jgi:hypothetical protein
VFTVGGTSFWTLGLTATGFESLKAMPLNTACIQMAAVECPVLGLFKQSMDTNLGPQWQLKLLMRTRANPMALRKGFAGGADWLSPILARLQFASTPYIKLPNQC